MLLGAPSQGAITHTALRRLGADDGGRQHALRRVGEIGLRHEMAILADQAGAFLSREKQAVLGDRNTVFLAAIEAYPGWRRALWQRFGRKSGWAVVVFYPDGSRAVDTFCQRYLTGPPPPAGYEAVGLGLGTSRRRTPRKMKPAVSCSATVF